jgi:indole-3-glycerol phosphate synthase
MPFQVLSLFIYILFYFLLQCPLLCKEFIIDPWQICYACAKGADAILLIAGVLPDIDIKSMLKYCRELGLTALIEVFLLPIIPMHKMKIQIYI